MPTFLTDSASVFADITSTFTVLGEGVRTVLSFCMQPPLVLFLGGSVFGIGIAIYKKLKH